jgi:hypothetical protein
LLTVGYGYLWRRHTHRIEDGLEVERFVADDETAMQQPVSGNVSLAASSGPSLERRTSIIEPVGNVYEPSLSSHRYPSDPEKQVDPAQAYADAAEGRHGYDEMKKATGSPNSSPRSPSRGFEEKY